MADNVVHIAFDADAKKQQERLFIRLFQIRDHEIGHAKGKAATTTTPSFVLSGGVIALFAARPHDLLL
jgi:hypothetical protein